MEKFTEDHADELAESIAKITAFAVQKAGDEDVEATAQMIVDKIKSGLDQIDFSEKVTDITLVEESFDILDLITDFIPNGDKIDFYLDIAENLIKNVLGGGFLGVIRSFFAARKAQRVERRKTKRENK